MKPKQEKLRVFVSKDDDDVYGYYSMDSDCEERHSVFVPKEGHRAPEPFNMFNILHEMGHAQNRDGVKTEDTTLDDVICCEENAWAYAKRCVKEEHHSLLDAYSDLCLDSYRIMRSPAGLILSFIVNEEISEFQSMHSWELGKIMVE